MANKTISDLTSSIDPKDSDVLLIEDGLTTMKITKGALLQECSKEGHTHVITDIESLQEQLDSMLEDIELADVAITGSYTDLIDTPDIPLSLSELENDMNYATQSYVANKIAEVQLDGSDVDLSGYVTQDEYQEVIRNKADKSELFSGSYEDLTNKPTIPNVSGFATHQYVKDRIAEAQLNGGGGGTGGSGITYNEHYESLTINSVQSINYDESNERLNIN